MKNELYLNEKRQKLTIDLDFDLLFAGTEAQPNDLLMNILRF